MKKSKCDVCANKGSTLCMACEYGELYQTQEEKDQADQLCDLMCGCVEDDYV